MATASVEGQKAATQPEVWSCSSPFFKTFRGKKMSGIIMSGIILTVKKKIKVSKSNDRFMSHRLLRGHG